MSTENHKTAASAVNRKKGILFILSAAFFFSLMTVFVRLAGDVPTMQKAFFRNIVATFLAAFILLRSGEKFYVPRKSLMDLFLRCSIGTAGILCNFWAVDHMQIADANILNKLSPFFAILMSIFILNERPDRVEWLSVLLAFTGAAFVAKPGAGIVSFPALIAILGGFTAGTACALCATGLNGRKGPVTAFSLLSFSTAGPVAESSSQLPDDDCPAVSFSNSAGCPRRSPISPSQRAYQHAPARDISVFDYSQVVYAAIWGFLLWGEIPDLWSFLGYAIIIGTAFGKWYLMTRRG